MKAKLFIFVLMVLSLNNLILKSQNLPIDLETGSIVFDEIVYLNNETLFTKDVLYNNAKEWFVRAFKTSKEVIQLDDKESGRIIGKGNFTIIPGRYLTDSHVDFTVTIMIREGRYRYLISDFIHVSHKEGYSGGSLNNSEPDCGNFRMMKKGWEDVKKQTETTISVLIADLKESMEKIPDDDW